MTKVEKPDRNLPDIGNLPFFRKWGVQRTLLRKGNASSAIPPGDVYTAPIGALMVSDV